MFFGKNRKQKLLMDSGLRKKKNKYIYIYIYFVY